jgi:HK97 gp10 family phage protein
MADVRFVLNAVALNRFFKSTDGTLGKLLLRIAQDVEGKAKRYAPVDTGRLRSSITSALEQDGEGLFAYVGSDVEYAIYVEYGTYRSAAQSFLRRALDEVSRGV